MARFSGTCVGGPYHGRELHHGVDRMGIAVLRSRPTKEVQRAESAPETDDITFGRYVHDATGGREIWIWYPPS